MASGLYIDARELKFGATYISALAKLLPNQLNDVLNANALEIERRAKVHAPADRGQLRQGISADTTQFLRKHITSHAPYSAYQEFGTGVLAANYVSKLPQEWKAYAQQFQGKSDGDSFITFVYRIYEWMKRKGIVSKHAEFRVGAKRSKSGKITTYKKRLGTGAQKAQQDMNLAYSIALSIIKKGVTPAPFMIPAIIEQKPQLLRDIVALMKKFLGNV